MGYALTQLEIHWYYSNCYVSLRLFSGPFKTTKKDAKDEDKTTDDYRTDGGSSAILCSGT